LENFESPLFFGTPAKIEVITTAIYNSIHHQSIANYQFATALSFAIMALMFLLVLWQWRLLRGKSFQTVTGKGYSPRLIDLGPWRWLTFALCVVFFLISVVLPIGQLILGSFFQFFGFYQ
jgi:iron(III) transport system permease protein